MKAILMSIKPKYVAEISNGNKTIEIRKRFPKDYVGWVYIYCTKDNNQLVKCQEKVWGYYKYTKGALGSYFNGKVVARFWCDKVEDIKSLKHKPSVFCPYDWLYYIVNDSPDCLKKNSCLGFNELHNYLQGKNGYAIHITKLEIFDKPKELWEFKTPKNAEIYKHDLEQAYEDDEKIGTRIAEGIANEDECANCVELTEMAEGYYGLTRAPQSWCYVEV